MSTSSVSEAGDPQNAELDEGHTCCHRWGVVGNRFTRSPLALYSLNCSQCIRNSAE